MRRLTFVPLAIGAGFVGVEFKQILNGLLVLGSLIGSCATRHGEERELRERRGRRERVERKWRASGLYGWRERPGVQYQCRR